VTSASRRACCSQVTFHGLRTEPAVTYLSFAIRHAVHHRGQLSKYLRAMGATVQAIHMESAGEPDLPHPPAFQRLAYLRPRSQRSGAVNAAASRCVGERRIRENSSSR